MSNHPRVAAKNAGVPFLRKQAWDYFSTHASQRMSVFNFYIALSSVTATTYAASWKADSNLESARIVLALLLCLFAFIFWKLDQRNRALIKNAERALKYYEELDPEPIIGKVFSQEESETKKRRDSIRGWNRIAISRWTFTYSHCFNVVFGIFFLGGLIAIVQTVYPRLPLRQWIGKALSMH